MKRPANERFAESLRAIIPDWPACRAVGERLGMTAEGVYNAVFREPAKGERGMTEAAFKRFAGAAGPAGYDVVVTFVVKEKSK